MGKMMNYKSYLQTILFGFMAMSLLLVASCSSEDDEVDNGEKASMITEKEALRIAHKDASLMYRDLSIYEITASLEDGFWFIDYEINDPGMLGGGPHYVISAETGEIDSFRYEQ
jgi:hypothetical protein